MPINSMPAQSVALKNYRPNQKPIPEKTTKKLGLLRAAANSQHAVQIGDRLIYTKAHECGVVPRHAEGKGILICLHPDCMARGREWVDQYTEKDPKGGKQALIKTAFDSMAEIPEHEYAKCVHDGQAHVYAIWYDVPVDPNDASKGVVGLVAPPERNVCN